MKFKSDSVRRRAGAFLVGFLALVLAAPAQADWREDMWKSPVRLRRGVTVRAYALEKPRIMKAYVVRVDLTTPGIRFTATERLKEGWRDPIKTDNKATDGKYIAETRLESTADFMKRRRASGMGVELAVNASFWRPFPAPKGEMRADPIGLCIADGDEVSRAATNVTAAAFVVYRSGKAEFVPSVDDAKRKDVSVAVSGFPMIMRGGKLVPPKDGDTHPRTAFGLTADKKTLVILVVDGRQKGYSEGAAIKDLYDILRREGVAEAVNMDGGGSSSLVVFDGKTGRPVMLNHHGGGAVRKTAVNLGIAFDGPQRKPDGKRR